MECGLNLLHAIEFHPDLNADEVREGQLLALTFGLPFAVISQTGPGSPISGHFFLALARSTGHPRRRAYLGRKLATLRRAFARLREPSSSGATVTRFEYCAMTLKMTASG